MAWTILLCLPLFGQADGPAEHSSPHALRLDRDERLTPGQTFRVEHVGSTLGQLSVWAESEELDLVLRIEPEGAAALEDDDTGGARNPWLRVAMLDAGERFTFLVTCKSPEASGAFRMCVRELPETEASRDAYEQAGAALDEANALDSGGERLRAVDVLVRAIDAYCAQRELHVCASFHTKLMYMARRCIEWFDEPTYLRAALIRREAMRDLYPASSEAWCEVQMTLCQGLLRGADPRDALAECEQALRLAEYSYPEGHINRAIVRLSCAQAYSGVRDLERADALMSQAVVEAEHAVQFDEVRLALMRSELGAIKCQLGELTQALELHRAALEVIERRFAPDHDTTLGVLTNLAVVLSALGDSTRTLAIHERYCSALANRVSPDNPEFIAARMNRAVVRLALGKAVESAKELEEIVADQERAGDRASGDGDLLDVALAVAWSRTGRGTDAQALLRARMETRQAKGRSDAVTTWRLEGTLAEAFAAEGQYDQALAAAERALPLAERSFPPEHPDLADTRLLVAAQRLRAGRSDGARELALAAARETQAYFATCATVLSMREAEAAQQHWSRLVSDGLTLLEATATVANRAESERLSFELCESARGIGTGLLRASRVRARVDAQVEQRLQELRRSAQRAAREVARAASQSDAAELDAALEGHQRAEEALRTALAREPGLRGLLERPDARTLATALAPDEALLAFWRHDVRPLGAPPLTPREARLLAFVVRSDGRVQRRDLGALAPIANAAAAWRTAAIAGDSAEGAAGAALRELVLDPLRPALEGASRWRVALDDVLHSAPLDALPEANGQRLGDRVQIVVAAHLAPSPKRAAAAVLRVVAVGGVDYEAEVEAQPLALASASSRLRAPQRAFAPLWETQDEIDGIATLLRSAGERKQGGAAQCTLLSEGDATKAALLQAAANATHLHIATHGFFALGQAESEPPSEAHLQTLASRAPLALCGLALAGANGANAADGCITADELALADLSHCELVALSACDTNVGVANAGQGVASFQKALHAAGAQTVVTSLWKVDDAATRELMVAFYSALWIDGLAPPAALWQAKTALRKRRAPARDWAGWVLSAQ